MDGAYKGIQSLIYDNALVAIGPTNSFGQNTFYQPNVLVTITDRDGQGVVGLTYDVQSWNEDYSIVELEDGSGFVWTTGVWNRQTGSFDIMVVRTDESGGVVWTRMYGGLQTDGSTSIIQVLQDGSNDLVIAGTTSSAGQGCKDGLLIRLDVDGNTQWTRTYGLDRDDRLWAVREGPEEDLYAVGSSNSFTNGNDDNVWLLRVDGGGNQINNFYYGGGANDRGYNLELDFEQGLIAMTGETYSFGNIDGDVYVILAQLPGNTIWEGNYDFQGQETGFDIEFSIGEGLLVVTGESLGQQDIGRGDAFFMELTDNGDPIFANFYGGTQFDNSRSIAVLPDEERYYLAGNTNSYGLGCGDQYLLRLDNVGFSGVDGFGNECPRPVDLNFDLFETNVETEVGEAEIEEIEPFEPEIEEGSEFTEVCDGTGNLIPNTGRFPDNRYVREESLLLSAPNPVAHGKQLTLNFMVEPGLPYLLRIVDVSGNPIVELSGTTRSGLVNERIDTDGWASGSYTATVQAGEQVKSAQIVIGK